MLTEFKQKYIEEYREKATEVYKEFAEYLADLDKLAISVENLTMSHVENKEQGNPDLSEENMSFAHFEMDENAYNVQNIDESIFQGKRPIRRARIRRPNDMTGFREITKRFRRGGNGRLNYEAVEDGFVSRNNNNIDLKDVMNEIYTKIEETIETKFTELKNMLKQSEKVKRQENVTENIKNPIENKCVEPIKRAKEIQENVIKYKADKIVKNAKILKEKKAIPVPQYFKSNKSAFDKQITSVLSVKKNVSKQIDLDKIKPADLYKKSVDASTSRISPTAHNEMIQYKPKSQIKLFHTESDVQEQSILASFAKEDLGHKIKQQNGNKIRRLLGDQKSINVEQIFNAKIDDVTNRSPNKYKINK